MKIDVSFVIVTFNYEKYILDSVNSCLVQKNSGLNIEVIIVDDGSQDKTEYLIKRNFLNDQIRFYKIDNLGIEGAANFGFNMAQGTYIVRVDADDLLKENYLIKIKKYLDNNYDFLYPNYFTVNNLGHCIKEVKLPLFSKNEILKRGDFLATGTLLRRELIKKYNGYNEKVKNCGLENYEFILILINNGHIGLNIPFSLFYYRIHDKNLSKVKRKKILFYGQNLFNKYNLGEYAQNEFHPYA